MDEVTIYELYGQPFQTTNKSVGAKIEGNTCKFLKVDEGLTK